MKLLDSCTYIFCQKQKYIDNPALNHQLIEIKLASVPIKHKHTIPSRMYISNASQRPIISVAIKPKSDQLIACINITGFGC